MTGRPAAGAVRLDAHLVRAGIARSRGHAAALVQNGRVLVDGQPAARVAASLRSDSRVEVLGDPAADYASRAGDKLAVALADLAAGVGVGGGAPAAGRHADRGPTGLRIAGRRCLDAGASTGGFTDVLLRGGAASVLAVDVGHDQLRPELAADPRVTSLEGVDIRALSGLPATLTGGVLPAELTVADLSFISLAAVLPSLAELTEADGDLLTLVKPQFEVGRDRLPRTGVVRDPADRTRALVEVAGAGIDLGLGIVGAVRSARAGRSGNIEFVVWWRRDHVGGDLDALAALAARDAGAPGVPDPGTDPAEQHDLTAPALTGHALIGPAVVGPAVVGQAVVGQAGSDRQGSDRQGSHRQGRRRRE